MDQAIIAKFGLAKLGLPKFGLAMFGMPGGMETVVILVVALLIFGRRLPDVARSVGKSIVEFKKGIRDVKDDIDGQARLDTTSSSTPDDKPKPEPEPKQP